MPAIPSIPEIPSGDPDHETQSLQQEDHQRLLRARQAEYADVKQQLDTLQAAAAEAKADCEAKEKYAFDLEQRGSHHSVRSSNAPMLWSATSAT